MNDEQLNPRSSAATSADAPSTDVRRPSESVVKLLAALQGIDVAAVEHTLVATQLAYKRGEQDAIEGALLDQWALLQGLAVKFLTIAGESNALPRTQTFANLGLRSIELARKTLATVNALKQPTTSGS